MARGEAALEERDGVDLAAGLREHVEVFVVDVDVTKWRKDPDAMPLWAFARINRILEIEAQEAREAVVVVR